MKNVAALTLAIVALTSLPAVAFDGGRGIHIALTDNAASPYVTIAEPSHITTKVAVADERVAGRKVAVAAVEGGKGAPSVICLRDDE